MMPATNYDLAKMTAPLPPLLTVALMSSLLAVSTQKVKQNNCVCNGNKGLLCLALEKRVYVCWWPGGIAEIWIPGISNNPTRILLLLHQASQMKTPLVQEKGFAFVCLFVWVYAWWKPKTPQACPKLLTGCSHLLKLSQGPISFVFCFEEDGCC